MFWLKRNLPRLVIAPSFGVIAWFVYGFILWTIYISFTKSKLLPVYDLWGVDQYFRLWSMPRWHVAVENLFILARILAIDFGKKRTGIAVTDELQIIASGLTTVDTENLIPFLKDYVSKENVMLMRKCNK